MVCSCWCVCVCVCQNNQLLVCILVGITTDFLIASFLQKHVQLVGGWTLDREGLNNTSWILIPYSILSYFAPRVGTFEGNFVEGPWCRNYCFAKRMDMASFFLTFHIPAMHVVVVVVVVVVAVVLLRLLWCWCWWVMVVLPIVVFNNWCFFIQTFNSSLICPF